jgi:hypothetical protein
VSVTVTNGCGSLTLYANVTIASSTPTGSGPPQPPTINGPSFLCINQDATYTATTSESGVTVVWFNGATGNTLTIPAGTPISFPQVISAYADRNGVTSDSSNTISLYRANPSAPQLTAFLNLNGTRDCTMQDGDLGIINVIGGSIYPDSFFVWSDGGTGRTRQFQGAQGSGSTHYRSLRCKIVVNPSCESGWSNYGDTLECVPVPPPNFTLRTFPTSSTTREIRIENVTNGTVFRYCANTQTFTCSNNCAAPDGSLSVGQGAISVAAPAPGQSQWYTIRVYDTSLSSDGCNKYTDKTIEIIG